MRRLVISAITAAALLTATAACGSSDDAGGSGGQAGGTTKVKVGAIPIVDVAPLHLGIQKGFFTEQGIDVEVVNTTGGAAAVPGVVSGEFDFAFGNLVSLIVARAENLPLKVLAEGNSSTGQQGKDFGGIVVPKDSPITSAAQLAGKTVAVNNLKNIGDTTVRASVRQAGGDPAAVKFVELPFPDMPAALDGKRVDAAWIVEPFFTVAQNQGAKVIASNFVDTAPNLTIAAYFTSEKLLQQKGDLAKRFTAAIEKSLAYAQQHPDEARAVLPSYAKIDPTVAEKMTLPAWTGQINRASVQTLADLMLTDGLVKEKVDLGELLP
ncbi:nitrate ABC transporter substrate-binding protein [Micromonospora sp. 15K316]|uniref:ABC transporter substrate-binding protein n=1 Tax=Micromonospora sp. 15K316 TaxID=2530376 RepID=UPI00104E3A2D|nr:ABC transporter substrate-binding protein [Micromonospora sp. 15K316]TDC40590.1 nitrate ABC transporter substrate-binding protein [Micromonospora sp. 15K316]